MSLSERPQKPPGGANTSRCNEARPLPAFDAAFTPAQWRWILSALDRVQWATRRPAR